MNCERCEERHGRSSPAVYLEDGWRLCESCLTAVGEQQEQDRFEAYWGGSTPQTLNEQHEAAAALKRSQR